MKQIICFFSLSCCALFAHDENSYRVYAEETPEHVKEFYALNHQHQTLEFVLEKKRDYLSLNRRVMDIWEALDFLDTLVDESDPDLDLPQSVHCFQTAEALRKDGHPRWLILTGFIHDLGKILALFDEPQWAVVGDTFPVGCAYSNQVIYPHFFSENPDFYHSEYQMQYGIYEPGCGLERVHMSWGHDEYLYEVVKKFLPKEALYIIRYHSFYSLHQQGAYEYLLSDEDRNMLPWLQLFSRYDLYSKSSEKLDIEALKPYYESLVAEFFPKPLRW